MTIQHFGGMLLLVALLKLIDIMVDDPTSGHYARRETQVFSVQDARVWLPNDSSFAVKGKKVYVEKMGPVWCIFSLAQVARGSEIWYLTEMRDEDCESKRELATAAVEEQPDSMGMSTLWVVVTDRAVRAPTAIINLEWDPQPQQLRGLSVLVPWFTGTVQALGEIWDFLVSSVLFNHSYLSWGPMTSIQWLLRMVLGGMVLWALWRIAGNIISGIRGG